MDQLKISERYLGKLDLDSDVQQRIGKGKIKTHVSLFSGCGGLDVGFAQAGIQTRVMIEWDKSACETLRENFTWERLKKRTYGHWEKPDGKVHQGEMYTGNKTKDGIKLKYVEDKLVWKNKEEFFEQGRKWEEAIKNRKKKSYQFLMSRPPATWYHEPEPVIMQRDICEVTSKEIMEAGKLQVGECSIISGGFPCQGFSLAGKRMLDDPRNKLYKQFVRIVDDLKPASIMGENVPGLVSMAKGETIHQICEDFANIGYDVTWDLLNAADYGVPQHRIRVILIGFRVDAMKFDGERPSFHIAACPGTIEHPYLFYERLKRWKNKELLARIESDTRCSFREKKTKCNKCGKPTNGAYFKGKPLCSICYNKRKVSERKLGEFWEKWTKETPKKKN